MFERFTQEAIKVIMLAQEEARRLGHNFVGTEQMLLGLIGEGDGAAALTLKAQGVTLSKAREEVEKIIGRGQGKVGVEIPFTPEAKRALEECWDQARQLGDSCIGTEHLLMALIADVDEPSLSGVAVRVLENLGAQLDQARTQIMYLRKETAPPVYEPFISWVLRRLFGNQPPAQILSKSGKQALQVAQDEARATGQRIVGSEHLLLAILKDQNSLSAQILTAAGYTLDTVNSKVKELVQQGPGDLGQPLNNTPRTERIIALAHREARLSRATETSVDHLLQGILRDNRGIAREVLNELGADCDNLRISLLEKMHEYT